MQEAVVVDHTVVLMPVVVAGAENYVDAKIPPAPTTDGTYVLTCTVTDGTPAYSWESAT